MNLVREVVIEQIAEHAGAPFDEQIGPAAPAQLVKETLQIGLAFVVRRQTEYLATRGAQGRQGCCIG